MLDFLLDIFFPSSCVHCKKTTERGQTVCAACFANIPVHRTLFCGTCHARIPEITKICHKETPYLLGAATAYSNETVRELIHALKFRHLRKAAEPLGDLLALYARALPQDLFQESIVLPIPLGKRRQNERGFNQAELIAQTFATSLNIAVTPNLLKRVRETEAQSELRDHDQRTENVKDCFVVNGMLPSHKTVFLIDDVTTSGSTFREAALALKRAGAKKIIALAVAKA